MAPDPEQHPSSSAIFAGRVREVRQRLNWNQADLAERLADLGVAMDRTAIARLETGKRDVSLDEALAICAALNVSPLHMMVSPRDFAAGPNLDVKNPAKGARRRPTAPRIAITPKLAVPMPRARAWLRGERTIDDDADPRAFYNEVSDEEITRREMQEWETLRQIMGDVYGLLLEDVAGQLTDDDREAAVAMLEAMKSIVVMKQAALKKGQQR